MTPKRVALIVDHPQRDLPGLLLVAHALCARGISCHLVPHNLEDREVPALAPDYVLLNYARVNNGAFAGRLAEAGIRFGVADTEGGVWDTVESYTELLWKDPVLRHKAHDVCMWGQVLARHIVKEGIFASEQVRVTGCPRFDYYDPKWRTVLNGAAPESSNGAGSRPRILLNTNFSVVNPRFTTRAQSIEWCHREYGWPYDSIKKVTDAEEAAIRDTVGLAQRLATDYPQAEIVLRPHPFENPAPYRESLAANTNVRINDSGPVQPEINKARVVIQRSCTTAVEAVAAGVPTLSPLWIPAPYFMPMAEAVSVPCPQYADLRVAVSSILEGRYAANPYLEDAKIKVISDWFHRIDGLSHRRVSEAIEEGLPAERTVDERLCIRFVYEHSHQGSVVERLSARARAAFDLSPDWSFRRLRSVPALDWTRTAKHLDIDEVRELSRRIEQISPIGGGLRIALARENGDYLRRYHGHSITVSPTKPRRTGETRLS